MPIRSDAGNLLDRLSQNQYDRVFERGFERRGQFAYQMILVRLSFLDHLQTLPHFEGLYRLS